MSDTLESRSGQLQYRNLWSCAEANGRAGGSYAAVDVQLPAGFLIPSAHVGSFRAYEGEAPVDERERQLAAMAVPGQVKSMPNSAARSKLLGLWLRRMLTMSGITSFSLPSRYRSTRCPS